MKKMYKFLSLLLFGFFFTKADAQHLSYPTYSCQCLFVSTPTGSVSSCNVNLQLIVLSAFKGTVILQRSYNGSTSNFVQIASIPVNTLSGTPPPDTIRYTDITPPLTNTVNNYLYYRFECVSFDGSLQGITSILREQLPSTCTNPTVNLCTGNPAPVISGPNNISFCDIDANLAYGPTLKISSSLQQSTSWSSSNSSIVSVDGFGNLIPFQFGSVTITANQTYCNQSATYTVNVVPCSDICNSSIYFNALVVPNGVPIGTTKAGSIYAGGSAGTSSFYAPNVINTNSSASTILIGNNIVDLLPSFDAKAAGSGLFNAKVISCTSSSSISPSLLTSLESSLNKNQLSLVIYPNPVNSLVNINFNTTNIGVAQIKIINSFGQLSTQKLIYVADKSTLQHTTIDLSKSPRGIYLVQIIDAGGQVTTKRLEKL